MKIAKLIIHPKKAKHIALEKNSKDSLEILSNIEEAINSSNSYVISDGQDPRKLPKEIENYEKVEIYGSRHGFCLSATSITLIMKGITNSYFPKGYF